MTRPVGTMQSTSIWPGLENWDWHDIQVGGGEEQNFNSWETPLQNNIDPQFDSGTSFFDYSPSMGFWSLTGSTDRDCQPQGFLSSPTVVHESNHLCGDDRFDSTSQAKNMGTTSKETGFNVGIARLSQLSTRLCSLHRSSCTLARSAGLAGHSVSNSRDNKSPLIDDTAFKSVTAWLMHVSGNMNPLIDADSRDRQDDLKRTGDTLHNAFSASHSLLETLHSLHAAAVDGSSSSAGLPTAASTTSREAQTDFWPSPNSQSARTLSITEENSTYPKNSNESSGITHRSNQHTNTVVHHLVIACHTILLNIYVSVLVALQHDADRWNPCRSTSTIDAELNTDTVALADIRPALTVQLCSYLIERQNQAVDVYLSSSRSPPVSQQHPSHEVFRSNTADQEAMSELKVEIQQRLERLRQTLRI
ncbi:hypothetical protein ACLMJK_006220 [Lecanora helva]